MVKEFPEDVIFCKTLMNEKALLGLKEGKHFCRGNVRAKEQRESLANMTCWEGMGEKIKSERKVMVSG